MTTPAPLATSTNLALLLIPHVTIAATVLLILAVDFMFYRKNNKMKYTRKMEKKEQGLSLKFRRVAGIHCSNAISPADAAITIEPATTSSSAADDEWCRPAPAKQPVTFHHLLAMHGIAKNGCMNYREQSQDNLFDTVAFKTPEEDKQ